MGTTSAGSIQLDLEVKSDLNDDINKSADKIAQKIKEGVKAMGGDLFKDLRIGIDSSLNKMTDTIKACLNRTKEEMRMFVSEMEALLKNAGSLQFPFNKPTNDNEPISTNTTSTSPRGPPGVSIRKPKIKFDPQFDTEMFQQKYYELENLMDLYDNQILEKQKQRKVLLAEPIPKQGSNAEAELNKQIQQIDIQIAKLQDAASTTNITLKAMDRQMNSAGNGANKMSSNLKEAIGNISGLKGKIASISFSALSKGAEIARQGIQRASNAISTFAKNATKSGSKKLGDEFKNAGKRATDFAKKLLHIGNASKGASGQMGRSHMGLKQMVKTFFVFSLIFPLVSKGIMALGQNVMATLKTNNQFVASLNSIRSNLATAFTPIIQAIMPALNALMSALAKVTGYIAAFVSLLFGKTYSATQQATQGIYDAKEAMGAYGDSAANAAKEAAKAQKQLLGFDEITKLESPNESSGGGSGGAPVYTPTEIDTSGISSVVDKIKNMFKNGKFEEIGQIIGESVNKGVDKITSFISWNNVGGQVTKFVNGFTRIFNSTVSTINWFNIGKMFGTGINTLVNTIYLLITGIDWKQLGSAFAEGLNGIVNTVDCNKIGATLGAGLQAAISLLYGFVTTADWPAIGKSTADSLMSMVNSINWSQLGKTLSEGVLGLISMIREFIRSINWAQLGEDISSFLLSIDWWGVIAGLFDIIVRAIIGLNTTIFVALFDIAKAMWDGLCSGIGEFFSNPGDFIKNNIVDPFINWIKDLFGIHSPSTIMAEIGNFLIEGLQNGISDLIPNLLENIGSWFSEIGTTIMNTWEDAKKWTTEKWSDIKTAVSDKVSDVATKVSSGFQDACNAVSTKCGEIKTTVTTKFNEVTGWIGSLGTTLWNNATKIFNDFCSGVRSIDIGGTVKSVVGVATDWLGGLWSSASTWGSDMMDGLASGIRNATRWVTDAVSNVADVISSWLHFSRPDVGPLHYYEEWMPDFMQGMAKGIESSTPGLVSKVRALASSISSSMQQLSEPAIAFAGEKEFGVTHRIEKSNNDNSKTLDDVISELKELKDTMKDVKRSIEEQDTTVEIDGKEIVKVVKKDEKERDFLR